MNKVVLVGNGPVPQIPAGLFEDAFVVRFNKPRRTIPEVGTRCDALAITNHGNPARHFASRRKFLGLPYIQPATEIWFPRPRKYSSRFWMFNHPVRRIRWVLDHSRHIVERNQLQAQTVVLFSRALWESAFQTLGLSLDQDQISPSTGFLTLIYALGRFPDTTKHLIAFTFEGSEAHPWAQERAAAERFEREGTVRWHR